MTSGDRWLAYIDAMLEGDRILQEAERARAEARAAARPGARGSLARTQLPPESRTVVSAGALPSEPESGPGASTMRRRH